jgi:hypothetical protein
MGLAALVLSLVAAVPAAAQDLRMVMFTQPGCAWCAAWDREIGPIWPRSPEGQAAPLERLDRRDPLPVGLTLDRRVMLTPTFVLLRDGTEVARLEGYPGQDFFWFHTGRMIRNAAPDEQDPDADGSAARG